MQDPNTANQGDLIFKLDQDRAWLLKNLDKGKWPEEEGWVRKAL